MKKCFCFLLVVLLALCGTWSVSARESPSSFEYLDESSADYAEIKAMEEEVSGRFDWLADMDGISLPDDFSVPYEEAYKIYSNGSVFDDDTKEEAAIREHLSDGEYYWSIPLSVEGHFYEVTVEPHDGGWEIGYCASAKEEREVNYPGCIAEKMAQLPGVSEYSAALVVGLPHIHYAVAVIFVDGKAEYLLPIGILPLEGTQSQQQALAASDTSLSQEIYRYDAVGQVVRNMPPEGDEAGGPSLDAAYLNPADSTFSPFVFVVLAVLGAVIVAAVLCLVLRRKRLG